MRPTHSVPSQPKLVRSGLVVLLAALASAPAASAATITVNTVVDDDLADGECSLREAILAANTDAPHTDCPAGAGPDRIVFTLAKGSTILLGSSLPAITDTLALRGPGAALLTIDGQDLYEILSFSPPANGNWLGVEELTLTRGLAANHGGGAGVAARQNALLRRVVLLGNRAGNGGGGLVVSGDPAAPSTVEIVECWFADNRSLGPMGGGGLLVTSAGVDVLIDRTTFSGNLATASGGTGGGLRLTSANVQIQRSTLSGNGASDFGGGITMDVGSAPFNVSIRDTTLTANRANDDGDADGDGGGIFLNIDVGETAMLELANTILSANVDSGTFHHPDASILAASLLTLTSSGFSLVGSNEGAESFFADGAPNSNGDYVGTAATPIDPELLALADNGGFGPDHRPALIVGTPVIDQGFCPGSPADQRGYGDAVSHLRIVDTAFANGPGSDGCDIGAHERAGDPGSDPTIFSDGFEWGHTLPWSTEVL